MALTAREVMNRLRHEGWTERAGKGAHVTFRKQDRRVIVANHRGDVPTGTLPAICAQAGWEYPPQR